MERSGRWAPDSAGADENGDLDTLLGEWRSVLEGIKPDVPRLHHHRDPWTQTNDAVRREAPPDAPATWAIQYFQIYVQSQASAIRRIVLSQSGSLALDRLLQQIASPSDVVTPERIYPDNGPVGGYLLEAVRGQLLILCTPEGHLDPAHPLERRESLRTETRAVTDLVNRTIAHIDPRGFDQEVTLQKLHESVDHIAAAFRWIGLLLNGTEYELTPIVQNDWTRLLSRPFFPR